MAGNGLDGTFLGEISKIMKKKKFKGLTLSPIGDGEEVVGKMNKLEKAVFTLSYRKVHQFKAICDACGHTEEARASAKCAEVDKLNEQTKLLKQIGFQLIKDRLNIHDANLGIRKGAMIVTFEHLTFGGLELLGGFELPGGLELHSRGLLSAILKRSLEDQ